MSLTGHRDGPPTKIGISGADAMGASVSGMAILAALYYKKRTGKGQHINVSMHDVMGWITAESWPLYYADSLPLRDGNRHWVLAPQNIFRARDGLVAIAVENEAQWRNLSKLIGFTERQDSFSYEEIKGMEEDLEEKIRAWAKDKTREDVVTACQEMSIPSGPVQEIADVAEHPHTWQREMIVELEHPIGGKIKLLGSPFKLSLTPGVIQKTAPGLGQDTENILSVLLGYTQEEIAALKDEAVILPKTAD